MNNQNTEMMERKVFALPNLVTGSVFTDEELADSADGLNLSFLRVKIPGGGAIQFEIPTDNPENPDYTKTLEGVIVYQHNTNSFWPEGHDYDENVPPQCQSMNGRLGIGQPGGLCVSCPYNQFGSGSNGKGKACKNMRTLYLLRSGEYLPIQLTLPPTSLRPFSEFSNIAFLSRRRAACGSVVQIGLKKASNGKDDYSVATFRKIHDFSGEELANIRAYAENFKKQVAMIQEQRTAELESASADAVEMTGPIRAMPENDGHFSVGTAGAVGMASPVRAMPESDGHASVGSAAVETSGPARAMPESGGHIPVGSAAADIADYIL